MFRFSNLFLVCVRVFLFNNVSSSGGVVASGFWSCFGLEAQNDLLGFDPPKEGISLQKRRSNRL